ncbi:Fructose-1,6-bisphosphate aldolase/phosphatase [Frankliniella fusca]|uniref:Fructose-1,6-bisphosphate aldolase/phosphatase n=1 Tax=Frankliniella fusca TaxID=407009 RepID=A0AAE1I287_9NEOP|nr:Fructose-1,6-bisphosphate aldolase/phosphatase [Frankliniella fusca]
MATISLTPEHPQFSGALSENVERFLRTFDMFAACFLGHSCETKLYYLVEICCTGIAKEELDSQLEWLHHNPGNPARGPQQIYEYARSALFAAFPVFEDTQRHRDALAVRVKLPTESYSQYVRAVTHLCRKCKISDFAQVLLEIHKGVDEFVFYAIRPSQCTSVAELIGAYEKLALEREAHRRTHTLAARLSTGVPTGPAPAYVPLYAPQYVPTCDPVYAQDPEQSAPYTDQVPSPAPVTLPTRRSPARLAPTIPTTEDSTEQIGKTFDRLKRSVTSVNAITLEGEPGKRHDGYQRDEWFNPAWLITNQCEVPPAASARKAPASAACRSVAPDSSSLSGRAQTTPTARPPPRTLPSAAPAPPTPAVQLQQPAQPQGGLVQTQRVGRHPGGPSKPCRRVSPVRRRTPSLPQPSSAADPLVASSEVLANRKVCSVVDPLPTPIHYAADPLPVILDSTCPRTTGTPRPPSSLLERGQVTLSKPSPASFTPYRNFKFKKRPNYHSDSRRRSVGL